MSGKLSVMGATSKSEFLPQPSTTGSADTRLSTKMLRALMMGVFG